MDGLELAHDDELTPPKVLPELGRNTGSLEKLLMKAQGESTEMQTFLSNILLPPYLVLFCLSGLGILVPQPSKHFRELILLESNS